MLVATAEKQCTTEKLLVLVSGKKKSARGILECEPGHGSLVILIFWPS